MIMPIFQSSDALASITWFAPVDLAVKSLLILAAAGVAMFAMRRASAATRHLVWVLAVVATLTLPLLSGLVPQWRVLPAWVGQYDSPATTIPQAEGKSTVPVVVAAPSHARPPSAVIMPAVSGGPVDRDIADAAVAVAGSPPPVRVELPAVSPNPVGAPQHGSVWPSARRWATVIWALGTAVLALPILISLVGLWRIGRRLPRITDDGWESLARELSAALRLSRPVTLLRGRPRAMPMTWGVLHPKLVLPPEAENWCAQRRRVVLMHELAHIKRKDFVVQFIVQVARAIYWFNPLMWVASRQIALESEGACDDLVLASETRPSDYAEHLLAIAAGLKEGFLLSTAAVAMARSSRLKARLVGILDGRRNRNRLTVAGVAMLGCLLTAVILPVAAMRSANAIAWARQRGWTSQEVQSTTLESSLGGWRNLPFSIPKEEEADARACIELARKSGETLNGQNLFARRETRTELEKILSSRPGYFYAEFLLGVWHQVNGDAMEADRWMELAYRDAPVVVVQRLALEDQSPLANVVVQSFALECNRVVNGSLDPSLELYYPNLRTDSSGFIYLPAYNTVFRADSMSSPEGYHVVWQKLGWFEAPAKVALLPTAIVTPVAALPLAAADRKANPEAHGEARKINDRERFLAIERIARLPAAEQAAQVRHLYRDVAPPCMSMLVEGILSSNPANILDRDPRNGFEGNTALWTKQLADAAVKLSPDQVAEKLEANLWINVAARARALQVLRANANATAALIQEDLTQASNVSVHRAGDVIQGLNLPQFTDQLLKLSLAGGEAAEPASYILIFSHDRSVIKPLLAEVEKHPKQLIRLSPLFAGPLQGQPAEPALIKLLDSADPDIRVAAASALSECVDPLLATSVVKLARETNPKLHEAALDLAVKLPDHAFKKARGDLLPLLNSGTHSVAFAAIRCFAKQEDMAAAPAILKAINADSIDAGDAVTVIQAVATLTGSTFEYDIQNWGPKRNQAAIRKIEAALRGKGAFIGMKDGANGGAADVAPKTEELSGMITDEAGTPLAGVLLHVWSWCDGIQTRTDEHGRYTLKNLGSQPVEIRVSKDGFDPWYSTTQPVGVELNIKLSSRTYFEGLVLGPDAKPVPNAQIRAFSVTKRTADGLEVNLWLDTRSDANGRYRLYAMADSYTVLVRVPNVGSANLPGQAIADGKSQPLDIHLTPGVAFRAQIVDSETGSPVANVKLGNWRRPTIEGTSDKDGNLLIPTMDPGKFEFNISAEGYARWWSAQATEDHQRKETRKGFHRNFDYLDFDITPDMKPVRIELEREVRITGVIQDPDGKPVAGATAAPAHTGTGNSLTGDTRYSVVTQKDGTFVMTLPASGDAKYNLEAHDGAHGQWRNWANGVNEPIQTKPGDVINNVVVKLTRPVTVSGMVKDETGKPIAGRDVRASAADRMENRYYDPTTKTDENGNFTLKFVRPGEHFIQAAPFWSAEESSGKNNVRVKLKESQPAFAGVELIASTSTRFPTVEEQIRRAIEKGNQKENAHADVTNLKGDWKVRSLQGMPVFRWRQTAVGDVIQIANVSTVPTPPKGPGLHDYYTITPGGDPAELDVTYWVDSLRQTSLGIYRLNGDTLTICIAPYNEKTRPNEFKPGTGTLIEFERVPQDEPKPAAQQSERRQRSQVTKPLEPGFTVDAMSDIMITIEPDAQKFVFPVAAEQFPAFFEAINGAASSSPPQKKLREGESRNPKEEWGWPSRDPLITIRLKDGSQKTIMMAVAEKPPFFLSDGRKLYFESAKLTRLVDQTIVAGLTAVLNGPDASRKFNAALVLHDRGDFRGRDVLKESLKPDNAPAVRAAAARRLLKGHDAAAFDTTMDLAGVELSATDGQELIGAVAEAFPDKAVPVLRKFWVGGRFPLHDRAAIQALAKIASPEAIDTLLDVWGSSSDFQMQMVYAIGRYFGPSDKAEAAAWWAKNKTRPRMELLADGYITDTQGHGYGQYPLEQMKHLDAAGAVRELNRRLREARGDELERITSGLKLLSEAPSGSGSHAASATQPSLNYGPATDGLQLALEIDAVKGVIPSGKPIKGKFHFRNAGLVPVTLHNPNLWQPFSDEFIVTDSEGTKVQTYSGWFSGWDVGREDMLAAGKSAVVATNAIAFYPEPFDGTKTQHPVGNYAFLKPGKYTLQYKLRAPTLGANPPAWQGELASAPMPIEVVAAPPAPVSGSPAGTASPASQPSQPQTQPTTKDAAEPPKYVDFSGVVVDDATGKPVPNFSVQGGLVDEKDPAKIKWGYTLQYTNSPNRTARFSSRVDWSGGWRSRIVADGYAGEPIMLTLPNNKAVEFEGLVIRLKRGRQVSGHLLDHTGKPVAGAGVFVVGNPSVNLTGGKAMALEGGMHEDSKAVRFATDANGGFTVTGIAEDRHHIAVTCQAMDLWVVEVPKEGGNINDLTVRLPEPGKLVVHYDIPGAPEKAEIFLQYHAWELFKDAGVSNQHYAPIAQREELVLNNLAPGTYVIDRTKNPGIAYKEARTLLDRHEITLESGKTVVLDFVRKTGAPITGHIVGLDQGEVAKANPTRVVVRVVPIKEDQWRSVVFDDITMEQGGRPIQSEFSTEQLTPGQYKVRVQVFVPEKQEQRFQTGIVPPAFVREVMVTVPESGKPEPAKIDLKPWVHADGI